MTDEDKKAKPVLPPTRRQYTEHANTDHTITVEPGVTIEDCIDPGFWAHIASMFSPYDEIRIRTDDGSWFARVLVSSCGRNWARVKVLEVHQLTSADVDMTQASEIETHEVRFRGPLHKFCVVRKADNEVLKDGCSKAEAYRWMSEYLKTVA